MSAIESCQRMSTTADNISSIGSLIQLLNPFKSANELRNEIENNLSISLSEKDMTDIQSMCRNVSNTSSSNILKTPQACIDMAKELCAVGNDPIKRGECAMNLVSFNDISQQNTANLQQNCMIDSLISKISKKDANLNNLSAILALQDAKGPFASNKVTNTMCNNLNSSISSDVFTRSLNSCINEAVVKQDNLISACGSKKISQSNFYNSINDCMAKNNIISNSSNVANAINEATSVSTQTASIIPVSITQIISVVSSSLLICIVCCIIIVIMMYFVFGKK